MGNVIKLIDIVSQLESQDFDDTIYVVEPWNYESSAVIEQEPLSGELPETAAKYGAKYFLEISLANDFLSDWKSSLEKPPTLQEQCERLIHYALNDA